MRKKRKTPKFQRLNGWDNSFSNDSFDIVTWVHLQTTLHTKKDTKKPKLTSEELVFRHLPKRRCPTLENEKEYEKQSLHKNFIVREKEETSKLKRSKTILGVSTNTAQVRPKVLSTRDFKSKENIGVEKESENIPAKIKSKDDIDVYVHKNEHCRNLNSIFPSKRSRSVPVPQATDRTDQAANNPSYRRLLYYARKYGSKEDIIYDEGEDEGYGSKTPSAEDKDMMKELDASEQFGCWNGDFNVGDNKVINIQPKVAKFSYTHQVAKSQMYDESEDEKSNKSDAQEYKQDGIKYYKTGYIDGREQEFVKRMLNRSHTTLSANYESTNIYPLEDLKPAMILRKISIQDSQGDKPQTVSDKTKISGQHNETKDVYEPHKTIVRQSSFVQNDRAQYPMYCTSPELKFTQAPTSRPTSKKSARGSRQDSANAKMNQQDLLNRAKNPFLDLYRSHTAVCMPIGDLLPAVDRSIRNRSNLKTKSGTQVAQSMPDIPSSILTPRKSNDESSATDISEKSRDIYNSISASPSEARVKLTTSRPREGTDTRTTKLELSMSGVDIEIKREKGYNTQRSKTYGKVLLTASPDKDTKKKLRDAFSRFYNKQPYGNNIGKKNWQEELKYIWKA